MEAEWKRPIDHRKPPKRFLDFLIGAHRAPQEPPVGKGNARIAKVEEGAPKAAPKLSVSKGGIGICCSGGGIRSAAYNLGALQVLQAQGILHDAKYLTAVSGGSYIAASHAIVARAAEEKGAEQVKTPPVYAPGSPEEQYLRNHSSYIAPTLRGKANLALRLFSGIAVNLGFVALFLFVLSRPLGWFYTRGLHVFGWTLGPLQRDFLHNPDPRVAFPQWSKNTILWPAAFGGAMAVLILLWRPPWRSVERFLAAWARRLLLFAVIAFVVLLALPYLIRFTRVDLPRIVHDVVPFLAKRLKVGSTPSKQSGSNALKLISALAGSATVLGAIRGLLAREKSYLAQFVGAVIGPLGLLAVLLWFLNDVTNVGLNWQTFRVWVIALAVFALLYAISDLTRWSMHPFYRGRLQSAFATRRVKREQPDGSVRVEAVPLEDKELPRLSKSQPASWTPKDGVHGPELVVCAAANISDEGATPPKRNAATFTFTAATVGGPLLGTYSTSKMEAALGEARGRDFKLITAVAVSGAAVSPSMGKMTKASLRFLMGILNVRLGVWLPNPRWIERRGDRREERRQGRVGRFLGRIRDRFRRQFPNPRLTMRPRPIYLVRELFGFNSMDDKFLYVTDGGHYENLGLVELLRRGCTEIYCFDASGGEVDTFFTLGEAIELARVEPDVGVEICIDPTEMKQETSSGFCTKDHVKGSFVYPDGARGTLMYCRAAVTADAPYDVRSFQQQDPRFPHHSTADQLFDEAKFEAYRALGAFTAEVAVQDMRVGDPPDCPPLVGRRAEQIFSERSSGAEGPP